MRAVIIITFLFIQASADAQVADSTWFLSRYHQFSIDTGTYLSAVPFIDKDGHKRRLEDFKGKILYLGIWASSCGSSISEFPYQEQLLKRLRVMHIDSFIQFINIHVEDPKRDWQKSLKKYNPIGINLHCNDTSVLAKWNIEAPPAYLILDPSGKVMGKGISQPWDAGEVDYVLYSAIKGIYPAEAALKYYRQAKLMEHYSTSDVIVDREYADWFDKTINSFLEFQNWRSQHAKKTVAKMNKE